MNSASFVVEPRGDLSGDVRVELEPAAEERAADGAGREQRRRRRRRRRQRRGFGFRFLLSSSSLSQLSLLFCVFFLLLSSPPAPPIFLLLFAIRRGVLVSSSSGQQIEQERRGPVGVFFSRGEELLSFRWIFERRQRQSSKRPTLSHLSFLAASGASPRALAAAAALELLVTVTPKRRSDFWTARSDMILLLFVRE